MSRRAANGKPKVVVLKCDECGHPIGNRGYLAVDQIAAKQRRAGFVFSDESRCGVAMLDRLIFWRIVHSGCDKSPRTSDYRIPSGRFTTTGDLLEATAHLMRRHPWVIETNWSGLIGRVLADTRHFAQPVETAELTKRRNGTADDISGTPNTEGNEDD